MLWKIRYRPFPPNATPFFNPQGRCVGRIVLDPDGRVWLVKSGLDPRRHKLRYPSGWATDKAHLDALRQRGGVGVRLVLNTGEVLEASLDDFDRYGLPIDRGHGPQVVLPEAYWRSVSDGEQLSLFDTARGCAR